MRAEKIKHKGYVITIDGASGTGKGIVSQLVAKHLGWRLLDSGALYRSLALSAEKNQVSLDDESAMQALAVHLDVQFIPIEAGGLPRILLEGEDVTDAIRTELIGNAASKAGTLPAVRTALLSRQRAFSQLPGLVADGRDMGTVVFPDADVKFFLTASAEERVRRRFNQLKEKGIDVNLGDLMKDISVRDQRDQQRLVAPLKQAADAIGINTDSLTIDEVVSQIMLKVRERLPCVSLVNEQ